MWRSTGKFRKGDFIYFCDRVLRVGSCARRMINVTFRICAHKKYCTSDLALDALSLPSKKF